MATELKVQKLNDGFRNTTLKIDGFVNADISPNVKPDQVVDFNQFPWPFKDNEFDHIVAKDILEHLGDTTADFIKVIKEMYRISHNGAIWEVQSPHWRCDIAIDDPDHKRLITMGMFNLFNKRSLLEKLQSEGGSHSAHAFEHDIDIEICDMQFEYTKPWEDRIRKKEVSQDELSYALNHFNNVALSSKFLIQVHKPGRCDYSEYVSMVEEQLKKPLKLTSGDEKNFAGSGQ